jgi:hypothetical protein
MSCHSPLQWPRKLPRELGFVQTQWQERSKSFGVTKTKQDDFQSQTKLFARSKSTKRFIIVFIPTLASFSCVRENKTFLSAFEELH